MKISKFKKERMAMFDRLKTCQTEIINIKRQLLNCIDCNINGFNYMVKNEVWEKAIPNYNELRKVPEEVNPVCLCIPCLEKRLNRKLTKDDFTDVPINRSILHMMK